MTTRSESHAHAVPAAILLEPSSERCPICGGPLLSHFLAHAYDGASDDRVSVVECRDCAFAWQHPRGRTPVDSTAFFEQAYHAQGQADNKYFDADYKREIAQMEIGFVDELATSGHTLLDIGAGAGLFARVADARGWQVTAIDPAIDPAKLAGTSIRALKGSLGDLDADARFDIVTMWDVIEHVDDPIGLLQQAKARVRPGGWLVIETGNYKCADRIHGGPTHWIYQLDHRWYFAPDSIKALLAQIGCPHHVLADRVLRPGWHGEPEFHGPRFTGLMRELLQHPTGAGTALRRYAELQRARQWGQAGMPIFCIAGRVDR